MNDEQTFDLMHTANGYASSLLGVDFSYFIPISKKSVSSGQVELTNVWLRQIRDMFVHNDMFLQPDAVVCNHDFYISVRTLGT